MKRLVSTYALVASVMALFPCLALAQDATLQARADVSAASAATNDQAPAQGAQNAVTETVKKFNIGVIGGIAVDPELITVGAFGNFSPIFSSDVAFRPGLYLSFGEVTTEFGIDLDFTYAIQSTAGANWRPYVGGGFNFALSHQSFQSPPGEDTDESTEETDRFDFGDTNFDTGFNFIVGAKRPNGVFFEMKATAYGVANVKLLAGFKF